MLMQNVVSILFSRIGRIWFDGVGRALSLKGLLNTRDLALNCKEFKRGDLIVSKIVPCRCISVSNQRDWQLRGVKCRECLRLNVTPYLKVRDARASCACVAMGRESTTRKVLRGRREMWRR